MSAMVVNLVELEYCANRHMCDDEGLHVEVDPAASKGNRHQVGHGGDEAQLQC